MPFLCAGSEQNLAQAGRKPSRRRARRQGERANDSGRWYRKNVFHGEGDGHEGPLRRRYVYQTGRLLHHQHPSSRTRGSRPRRAECAPPGIGWYTKGIAEVQFVVATGGAASLSSFTDSLLVNYERAAKSAGKEVDLRRSQLHDFGGKGFPQGKLIAVFHTVPDTQNAATFYKMATEQRDAGAIRNLRSAAERGDAAAQYSNTRRVR